MATLNVGPGQAFATIASAVNASRDGDLIAVQAGTYTNDFAEVRNDVTIQAVGGTARLVATVPPPNGKAILVTQGNITIDGLEFTGTAVRDQNGAGIRYEGGNLTINNSLFQYNQMGLLAGDDPSGSITIRNSEFGNNGVPGVTAHGLYVNQVGSLVVEGSYFHDALQGHLIKSRALSTTVRDSRIQDEEGTGSYSVDLPNGGRAVLTGNTIEQGAASQNPSIVHFGGEGGPHPGSSLEISGNTIINNLSGGTLLYNQTSVTAAIADNATYGLGANQIASGPAAISGNIVLTTRPSLDTSPEQGSPAANPLAAPPTETAGSAPPAEQPAQPPAEQPAPPPAQAGSDLPPAAPPPAGETAGNGGTVPSTEEEPPAAENQNGEPAWMNGFLRPNPEEPFGFRLDAGSQSLEVDWNGDGTVDAELQLPPDVFSQIAASIDIWS